MMIRRPDGAQRRERLGRRRLDRVRDRDQSARALPSAARNITLAPSPRSSLPPARQRRHRRRRGRASARRYRARVPALRRARARQVRCPTRMSPPSHSVRPRRRASATIACGERMLAARVEARGEPQQLGFVECPSLPTAARNAGRPSVSVPVLSTISVSTGAASRSPPRRGTGCRPARAAAGRDHDRHRRREPERTGTGDDQHRDGVQHRVGPGRLRPEPAPDQESRRARSRAPPARTSRRHRVGEALHRRARALGLRPPAGRSARASVSAPTRSARMTRLPFAFMRAADQPVARLLFRPAATRRSAATRPRWNGPRALRRPPAPCRPAARAAGRRRARASSGTSSSLPSVAHAPRGRRREAQQRLDRRRGRRARAQLQHLAEQRQRHDDGRRLEVDADAAVLVEGLRKQLRRDRRDDAVEEGRADAGADQRPHVRIAGRDRLRPAHEERPGRPTARPAQRAPVRASCAWSATAVVQDGRTSPAPSTMSVSGSVHQKRRGKSASSGISSSSRRRHHRLERHAADRAMPGAVAHDLRVHRAGVAIHDL